MIDTSIQLNNHNSYHATELFWADTFSVQTMTHITASFALYSDVIQAAADRIKIRFYTASGATVSETSHAFAVNTIWERVSVTVAVPATAEKAQICFLAGSYWWAESKVEEGQTATPYAINAAGQLTWISPNGVYTGTVTAQQVIVSPLSGATEKDLESRLVTINSNAINLRATTDNNVSRLTTLEAGSLKLGNRYNGVKIDQSSGLNIASTISGRNVEIRLNTAEGLAYYSGGAFIGGLKMVDGQVSSVAGAITSDTNLNRFAKMGSTPYGYGMTVYDKTKQSDPVISVQSGPEGGAMLLDEKQVARFHAYPDGHIILRGLGDVERLSLAADGAIVLRDKVRERMIIYPSSLGMVMIDSAGRFRQAYDANATYMMSPNGNLIGVDNGGAYQIKSGVKTYL